MIDQAITSLAILKVNWDHGKSYIDNFSPFVLEAITATTTQEISLPDLQEKIKELFSLNIPQGALRTILNKLYRHGYITYTSKVYVKADRLSELHSIIDSRNDLLQLLDELLMQLRRYAKEKYDIDWSKDDSEAAFLGYIEEHSLSLLNLYLNKRLIDPPAEVSSTSQFVVRTFIIEWVLKNNHAYEFLESVVKGRMLANTIFLENSSTPSAKIREMQIFFDTRFTIRLLGLSGTHLQAPCKELLTAFKGEPVSFHVFEDTINEIHGILDATAWGLRSSENRKKAYGETFDHCIASNLTSSDIELKLAKLPDNLASYGITILPRPTHKISLSIDESKLETILQNIVGYRSKEALHHDIDVLTAIHRIRNGNIKRSFEKCKAIFITTNNSLAKASCKYFQEEYEGNSVPLCTLDSVVTTLMWVKKPLDLPELPRKRIIADCYTALNPQDNLWKKYLAEISQLEAAGNITEEDYHLLRFSTEARLALMEVTLGSPDAFVEGSIYDILKRARDAAQAEILRELEQEREKAILAFDQNEDLHKKIEAEKNRSKENEMTIKENLDKTATKKAKLKVYIFVILLFLTWFILVGLIIKLGWSVMEEYTYYIGGSITVLAIAITTITQKEFSPFKIYKVLYQNERRKLYKYAGLILKE